ncbi:MAG: PspC domain-containing protein [Turicibacter sp.]|nr:PspC domain-containing protein [Turicibacter sp.]
MSRKLTKSRNDRYISGVCGGVAEYFGMDSTIVRLLLAVFVFFGGSGIFLYIICAIVMPEASADDGEHYDDENHN